MSNSDQDEDDLSEEPSVASRPFVSVIIPHLNDLENLDVCLRLLGEQTYPQSCFEIIVCDNGSRIGLDAVKSKVGDRAKVLYVDILGAGPARNFGVARAAGSILAFIDSDCRPCAQWIAEGIAALATSDVVGGQMAVSVADPNHMTDSEAFEMVFAFRNRRYVNKIGFTVTASMFVSKTVFERVGEFHHLVPEDVEWCRRALALGYTIGFAEKAVVIHPARRTMADLRRKWLRLTNESFEMQIQSKQSTFLWLLRSWVVLLSIGPHMLMVLVSDKLTTIDQKLLAIRALIFIRSYRFWVAHRLFLKDINPWLKRRRSLP